MNPQYPLRYLAESLDSPDVADSNLCNLDGKFTLPFVSKPDVFGLHLQFNTSSTGIELEGTPEPPILISATQGSQFMCGICVYVHFEDSLVAFVISHEKGDMIAIAKYKKRLL